MYSSYISKVVPISQIICVFYYYVIIFKVLLIVYDSVIRVGTLNHAKTFIG